MGDLRVIGAGLPRTGTTSLKAGLEQLLDGTCYHMFELMNRRESDDGVLWWQALQGDLDALDSVLDSWTAAVDWPTSLFWRELADRNPDAKVVLSHRGSADVWWASVDATVWKAIREQPAGSVFTQFNNLMLAKAGLGDDWATEVAAKALYDRHYDEVTTAISAERLVIWQPSDGWAPLCSALDLPVPDNKFGHHNTRADFVARLEARDAT